MESSAAAGFAQPAVTRTRSRALDAIADAAIVPETYNSLPADDAESARQWRRRPGPTRCF